MEAARLCETEGGHDPFVKTVPQGSQARPAIHITEQQNATTAQMPVGIPQKIHLGFIRKVMQYVQVGQPIIKASGQMTEIPPCKEQVLQADAGFPGDGNP